MRRRRRPLVPIILLSLGVAAGCGRGTSSSSQEGAATRPTTAPVAEVATAGEGGASVLTISNRPYQFRPARLIAEAPESGEPGVVVQVFSEGASPEGASDGYYLEMRVDAPDASHLDGASWQYASKSNERADDVLSAITVNGGANQLQPQDVTVTFRDASPGTVEVRVIGSFNVFNGRDASTAAGVVPVEATLLAKRQASR